MADDDLRGCRRFAGRVCVVTASTAGIGLAIAERLGREGAAVVVSSRRQEAVDETVARLERLGIECSGVTCHVDRPADVERLLAHALSRHGGTVDCLVSNAAANPEAGPLECASAAAVAKVLQTNVASAVGLVAAFTPALVAAAADGRRRAGPGGAAAPAGRGPAVVLVSSVTAFDPSPPLSAYAASKTALLGLTKALAHELGPRGVRVNGLCPGIVPTRFAAALVDGDAKRAAIEAQTDLGRLGEPRDVAAACAFLLSDDAAYVTGENLVVAGGMRSRL